MNVLQSLFYGLISGFAEFLPISSRGHQAFLKKLFGTAQVEPVRDMMIHIAVLLAIIISCGTYIVKLQRQQKMKRNRRSKHTDKRAYYDFRLIRTTFVPMILVMIFHGVFSSVTDNLALLALCMTINGVIVYFPNHLAHGNKDSSKMSTLGATLMGICAGLSAIPGISRVGAAMTCAISQGADQHKAYNWVLLMSIPAVLFWIVVDLLTAFSVGFGTITFIVFIGYFLSALFAFGAAMVGIYLMRFLTVRVGFSGFGFYCWGAALLAFILYLTA